MKKTILLMAAIALMPALAMGQQAGRIVVSEGEKHATEGAEIQRTVKLAKAPTDVVTVKVMSSDEERLYVKTGAVMTFTAEDWDTPQTAVFEAVDDYTCNGDAHLQIIYFSTSKDKNFSECKRTEPVTVADNDLAAVSLTPNPLNLNKNTKNGFVFVRLKAQPTTGVQVVLRSNNPGITIAEPVVEFNTVNWNVVHKVPVALTGEVSALEELVITAETSSEAEAYNGISAQSGIRLVGTEAEIERKIEADRQKAAELAAQQEADGKKGKAKKPKSPEQLKKEQAKQKAAAKKAAEKKRAEAKKAAEKRKKEAAKKKAAAKKKR